MGQLFAPIRRRWYTVALLAGVCFAAAILIGLRQPPGYQATALLEVQGLNDDFLNLKGLNSSAGEHAAEPYLQTQVKILQSSDLLGRIADKLELEKRDEFKFAQDWAANPFRSPAPAGRERLLKDLSKHLTVRISVGTRIIEVTGESTDPKLASELANTAGKELIDLTLARRLKNNQDTTRWLSEQLRDLKGSLEWSEQALQRYAREAGLLFTSETDSVAEAKLRQLQEALSKAQSDRVQEQARYERAVASPPDSLPEVLDDSALKDYQVKLTDLRRQFAERSSTLTASHYRVRELRAQIAELETAFERGRANVLNSTVS
ncbi:MAG: Wzz/FepE/Etk N-terminal domain-containing protein [Bryobacterales bacterium]|nr:Wzz/FepE/Etk N-terminal domain-containing protein [Bryobacterales bacterium]